MDHIVLALILSCSVHPDDNLIEALAARLSLNNQFFVGDLSTLDTYDSAKSVEEASRIVAAIQARGGRPAVGYLAVPVTWAGRFGRSLPDLFDGCTNIGVGTAMLSDYARFCSVRKPKKRLSNRRGSRPPPPPSFPDRACLLRRLEADINLRGIAEHVLPVAGKLDVLRDDPGSDPPPAQSAVFPDNSDTGDDRHEWSSSRLFLAAPAPASPPSRPSAPAERQSTASTPASSSSRRSPWESAARPPER